MSFFVHSDDFDTGGSSSDGTWSFGRSLKGNWSVIGQHMDTQSFPWLWDGCNFMVMRIHDPLEPLDYTTFEITFNPLIGFLSDLDDIGTQMVAEIQNTIDAVAINDPYAARTVSYTLQSSVETMTFNFAEGPVDILWSGDPLFPGLVSTINVPLGKDPDAANETGISNVVVSTHNMDVDPKYVEVYIAESNTQFSTSHSTLPTLFFSTRDGEFTGQTFSIPKDTHTLTIQIKRMSDSLIVPLTGTWYLIFQSAS